MSKGTPASSQIIWLEGRIVELTDAFNRVCDENVDFVAESIKGEARIEELEAEVMEFKSRGNVAMSSWDEERERALREGERVAELEANVKTLREALIDMRSGWKYIRETHGDLYGVGWDRAQNKADAALAAGEGK